VTDVTRAVGRSVKEADPSRPWCFPMQPHYFRKWWGERGQTDGGDLLNCHYPRVVADFDEFKPKGLDRFNRPFLSGEYAHAYGLDSGLLETYDDVMTSASNYIGGAVWMFQDQGIRRKSSEADPRWRSSLVHPDADHVYDSHGEQGTDGVVYADRTPQTDYFELRKVYAPVRIADPEKPLEIRPGQANRWTLAVENRFDFTNLKGVKGSWRLIADRETLASGSLRMPDLVPHATGDVSIEGEVPGLDGRRVCWLEVSFAHPRTGVSVCERTFPLRVDLSGFGSVRYVFGFDERTGRIRFASGARTLIDSPVYFRADRRKMLATDITVGKGAWKPQFLAPKSWRVRSRDEKRLDVDFTYAPTNLAPETAGEICLQAAFALLPDRLHLTYSASGAKDRTVTENGLAFALPDEFRRFDWIGAGPYECYPRASLLSEFGLWSLDRDDLYFPGTRRGVRLACASSGRDDGVVFIPDGEGADVAFERSPTGTFLSHVCVCAGKGGKFTAPLLRQTVRAGETVGGGLSVYALTPEGGVGVQALFGPPPSRVFRPFFKSYDD